MDMREVILVIFTILAQMSVGAFLVLVVVKFFVARKAGVVEADRMGDRSLIAIIVVLGLGLIASLFHLGSPLAAPRAINNIGTSWLSREILFGSIFFVLGALYSILQWFKWGPAVLRNVIAWLAALVGIVLVYSMSMVYMLPTQPAWNNLATPVSFYTTTLLLGALAMGAAFVANYAYIKRKTPDCADLQCTLLRSTLRWIAVASVILLGVEFVVTPIYLVSLATGVPQAVASAKLIAGPLGPIFLIRMILAFIGAGVFGFFLYQNSQNAGREKLMGYLAYSAFVLVLIAEVLGRLIFYSSHVGITL
jgi:anaerobic dimethyl sulfoxide reductase subunit C (anchor subunit)